MTCTRRGRRPEITELNHTGKSETCHAPEVRDLRIVLQRATLRPTDKTAQVSTCRLLLLVCVRALIQAKQITDGKKGYCGGKFKDYVSLAFHLGANIKKPGSENVPQTRDGKKRTCEQKQTHRYFL